MFQIDLRGEKMSKFFYYDKVTKQKVPIKKITKSYSVLDGSFNGYNIIPTDEWKNKNNVLLVSARTDDINAQKAHRAFWAANKK